MIQQGVAFLAWFLFFLCIEHLGKRDLAATNIVRAVSSLIFMFINAFASTASSLVSNLLGAGYAEQIMPLCRKMIRLCFCFVLRFASWQPRFLTGRSASIRTTYL